MAPSCNFLSEKYDNFDHYNFSESLGLLMILLLVNYSRKVQKGRVIDCAK